MLENITYQGLSEGATSLSSVSQSGAYYWFEFENLTHQNGNPVSQSDINQLQLWKKQGSGWQRDVEFEPGTSTEITEDKSSALIMLVLDCTTSLGDDFTKMKTGAKRFIETLSSTNTALLPTVTTNEITNITLSSATCGGRVTSIGNSPVTARGVCWSLSQNPTINDSHTTDGTGIGNFSSIISNITQGKTYYVRAYATNSSGTSYGFQKTFNNMILYNDVSVKVELSNNQPAVGAVVKFENYNQQDQNLHPVAPITIGNSGYYCWDSFWKGNYKAIISLSGHQTIIDSLSVFEPSSFRWVFY